MLDISEVLSLLSGNSLDYDEKFYSSRGGSFTYQNAVKIVALV